VHFSTNEVLKLDLCTVINLFTAIDVFRMKSSQYRMNKILHTEENGVNSEQAGVGVHVLYPSDLARATIASYSLLHILPHAASCSLALWYVDLVLCIPF
jgi:hypothetical protein